MNHDHTERLTSADVGIRTESITAAKRPLDEYIERDEDGAYVVRSAEDMSLATRLILRDASEADRRAIHAFLLQSQCGLVLRDLAGDAFGCHRTVKTLCDRGKSYILNRVTEG